MPAFIRSKQDEARWSKAKKATSKSKGKVEESFDDRDWALVNHIYQQMAKDENFAKAIDDEFDEDNQSYFDPEEAEQAGMSIVDPTDEQSAGEDWLSENDPNYNDKSNYKEYDDGEDEDAHIKGIQEDIGDLGDDQELAEPTRSASKKTGQASSEAPKEKVKSRFVQPTSEELNELRGYTMPYERRLRNMQRLEAAPEKNPDLAHEGHLIEATRNAYEDRQAAYKKMIESPEYKDADPLQQIEMDEKFHQDWHVKNPSHAKEAMLQHHEAHGKGAEGKKIHGQAKQAQIQHIIGGGASGAGETFSTEEGLQHAGGAKGEEGTVGTIVSDPAATFAASNPEFIKQLAEKYRSKPPVSEESYTTEGRGRDQIRRLLGDAPAQNEKFNQFYAHHRPLIDSSKKSVAAQLGLQLDPNSMEHDMLDEAGLHGLTQAINDYNHDNPSGASFATHARRKIQGLMMSALKGADQIPQEVRNAHKEWMRQKQAGGQTAPAPTEPAPAQPSATPAPKVNIESMLGSSKHPKASEMAGRLKQYKPHVVLRRKSQSGGTSGDQ